MSKRRNFYPAPSAAIQQGRTRTCASEASDRNSQRFHASLYRLSYLLTPFREIAEDGFEPSVSESWALWDIPLPHSALELRTGESVRKPVRRLSVVPFLIWYRKPYTYVVENDFCVPVQE